MRTSREASDGEFEPAAVDDSNGPAAKRPRLVACDGCKLNKTRCQRQTATGPCERCRTRGLLCSLVPVPEAADAEPLGSTTPADRTLDDLLRGFLRTSALLALRSGVHFDADEGEVADELDASGDQRTVYEVIGRIANAYAPSPFAIARALTPAQETEALRIALERFVPLLGWPPSRVPDLRATCPSLHQAALAIGSRVTTSEASSTKLYQRAIETTMALAVRSSSLAICLAVQLLVTWPAPRTSPTSALSSMAVASASALGLDRSADELDRQIWLSVYVSDAMTRIASSMDVTPTTVTISSATIEGACLNARLADINRWHEAFDNAFWADHASSPFAIASTLVMNHSTLDFSAVAGRALVEPDPARRRLLLHTSLCNLVVTLRTVLRPVGVGLAGLRSQVATAFGCSIATDEASAVFNGLVGPIGWVGSELMMRLLMAVLQHSTELSAHGTLPDAVVLSIVGAVFGLTIKAEVVRKAAGTSLESNSAVPDICRRVAREFAAAGPYAARCGAICSRLATLSETASAAPSTAVMPPI